MLIFLSILVIIIFILVITGIKIVPESNVYVIETLGKYNKQLKAGFNIINPIFDKIAKKVSLKETVNDFPPQPVITKDNATMMIDTVVYFQITDPKLYTYGVENPISAIENLTATTLRNIIGDLTVDQTLTSRDTINSKMRVELDEATDPWGIKVNRVELKTILPPDEIRIAMEKEMKAEREKRATILDAQAKKESAILIAEGEKQASILKAEAEKEAQGKAQAMLELKKAESEGLRILNENLPDDKIIKLKALETLTKVADGQATKIIIPSEIQNLASLITNIKEL